MILVGLVLGVVFVLPCVVVYGLFIKGIDRYEPEPWSILVVMFLWGALVSTTSAAVVSIIAEAALRLAAGAGANDQFLSSLSATTIAPLTEETAKGVGLLLLWGVSAWRLKELDGALDGALYGGVVGLGFTLTEDVLYLAGGLAENGPGGFAALFVVRTVLAGLAHASFTALTGLGIGMAAEARSRWVKLLAPLLGWAGAVGLHAIHNVLATFLFAEGAGLIAKILLFWLLDAGYFVLLIGLVLRDRNTLIGELQGEVGGVLSAGELAQTVSLRMFVPLWNYASLSRSPGGYSSARAKQLWLVDLAFLKRRRARGEAGLDEKEGQLRQRLAQANQAGVRVGAG